MLGRTGGFTVTLRKYCVYVALILLAFTALIHALSALTRDPMDEAVFVGLFRYLALTFFAGKLLGFLNGVLVGVFAGITDSVITLFEGLTINDWLPYPEPFTIGSWLYISFFVIGTGAVIGAIGSGIGSLLHKRGSA